MTTYHHLFLVTFYNGNKKPIDKEYYILETKTELTDEATKQINEKLPRECKKYLDGRQPELRKITYKVKHLSATTLQ